MTYYDPSREPSLDTKEKCQESIHTVVAEDSREYPLQGLDRKRFVIVFGTLLAGFFMSVLDQTVVITALETISNEFHGADDISWVGTAYLVTMSGFQPMYGIFADIIGHKQVYLIALAIFLLGSILCGAAQSMMMLIISRAVQGIGGAGLVTVVLIIICDLVPDIDRAKYQSVLGVVFAIAALVGPVLGGVLSDLGAWRWLFYINPIIGVPAMGLLAYYYPKQNHERDVPLSTQLRQVDYGSLILLMPGTICLLTAVHLGAADTDWDQPRIIALFAVGTATIVTFVISEIWLVEHAPIFPRRMVLSRTNTALFLAQFAGGIVDYAVVYYVPLQFQLINGDTALISAIKLLSFFIPAVIASIIAGFLISRTERYRLCLWLGSAIVIVGSALMYQFVVESTELYQYASLATVGFGVGLCKQAFVVGGQAAVSPRDLSIATAHGQFFRIIGGALGINLGGSLLSYYSRTDLEKLFTELHFKPPSHSLALLKHMPASLQHRILATVMNAFDKVYLLATVAAVVTLVACLFVKHYDIRKPKESIMHNEKKEIA
ncbi:major facilitator superfamily domain-containing protein [Radiomyces spectabilis]|uniref:major facilitator superfamily domain-containing protein n=1 Tax=Radiomyces spectabilis TaxID=64574 RepID=UPI00221F09D8|nr:major facilitator superfamily domain-containing protein [Radiomyces spectabilis]KAI8393641.1 major facilitator superfamily domain-containing protein [Radiomyces spectabilis]